MSSENSIVANDEYWTHQDSQWLTMQGLSEYLDFTASTEEETSSGAVSLDTIGRSVVGEDEFSLFFYDQQGENN